MTVSTKDQVFTIIQDHREQIQALGVKRLGLFGSFVRGEQKPESDIDILVEFEPQRKAFDAFMKLVFLLEDLSGRRVELVTAESLSPNIAPHIMNEIEYVIFSSAASLQHVDGPS